MRTTSYSDLRKNLAAMIDRVSADHEPIIITRDRGKPPAVLMSLEDFASYEETRYLLKSPANAERLRAAVEALEQGGGTERTLAE
ncbi:MAG: antitoxin YefM [Sphingomonadales bacterium]|jgi:antitoxin YefM|nr:antitoxin YefM [Sphingomonadales bacterium]